MVLIGGNCVNAEQILPQEIVQITQTIEVPKTGEKGKWYFYCSNGKKCSTEDVVRDYYQNNGYKAMRAEVSFWQAMFALAFFDEIFYNHEFEQTLIKKPDKEPFLFCINDIPRGFFAGDFLYLERKKMYDEKYKFLKQANIYEYINSQIEKYGDAPTRILRETEENRDCIDYFKTPIVQEFLKRINPETFATITYQIAKNPRDNRAGTPDFIVWNNEELILVEVKREKETLRDGQIVWIEFLLKNKIPAIVMRVKGI